ncbi:MAG: iron-containing alcohol dehydrogenase [Candidatus Hydrogenedens sp.]|jgi:alcohol dehydrogenase class IV|nr:iron-containing alcohol dehydrogenase [Candidatus Hydrogenedens sp.]
MSAMLLSLPMPAEVRFGRGSIEGLLPLCESFGKKGFLVHGASIKKSGKLASVLSHGKSQPALWEHEGGEPTLTQTTALRGYIREVAPDWVIALGGGSVLDLTRAAAGLAKAPGSVLDYHDGAEIPEATIPFIAVPTTAGTGSEATTVSVLTNTATSVKKSIRHPSFMARLVILDPELLESCPVSVLAASGMDALTQALEAYCSRGATALTDSLAFSAAEKLYAALPAACEGDNAALDDLLLGCYMAGVALATARLGLVHGLAHPLGARYEAAHGLVCAFCLPPVLAFNRSAIPEKYGKMEQLFGEDPLVAVETLIQRLKLESPFRGKKLENKEAIIEESLASGSTKANPREVSREDVVTILKTLFA